jgi:antitoxin component YwqK of YwqJK toxin-antitoxin module
VRLAHFQGGLLEGESTDFGPGGAVLQSCTYRANRLHGPLRRYGPNGAVIEEVSYRMGVPVGAPVRRDLQGRAAAAPVDTALPWPERLRRWARGA